MIHIKVDVFPLFRGTASRGDVIAVDQLCGLFAEHGLSVSNKWLGVTIDLDKGLIVEGVQASEVPVALAFVTKDTLSYIMLMKTHFN